MPPLHLNLLVVGGPGLGKTQLVQNMAAWYGGGGGGGGGAPEVGSRGHGTATLADFIRDPESMCTALPDIPLDDTRRTVKLQLQDTPAYGDTLDLRAHLRAVVQWQLRQQARNYEWAGGSHGLVRHSLGVLPHAATVCLFLLPPHRWAAADLEYMSALSKVVPVIPLISKADCHTPEELRDYRRHITHALAARKNATGESEPVEPFRFSPAALASLQVAPIPTLSTGRNDGTDENGGDDDQVKQQEASLCVFSVITSRHYQQVPLPTPEAAGQQQESGRGSGGGGGSAAVVLVPVRRYPWGSADALRRDHSDTVLLQRLLREDVWSLLEEAVRRYLAFCEQYDAAGRDVERLAEEILASYDVSLEDATATARCATLAARLAEVEAERDAALAKRAEVEATQHNTALAKMAVVVAQWFAELVKMAMAMALVLALAMALGLVLAAKLELPLVLGLVLVMALAIANAS
ncbi:hypothetical protein PLESTB_001434700 [Pleodorina starrii]|uniref:Septin-type G domain-containing protein n=1 Tax=Pleodorina starrii TaxID=330485 RepID=A0A9W6BWA7_9CHLO|nr:hypothetical protein PLESTB_001434700 [Pleodorina starrii]